MGKRLKKTKVNWGRLIFALVICQGAGILGSMVTSEAVGGWYLTLNKPSFTPPGYVIGTVWIILYFLMGLSLYLAWQKKLDLTWFWIQLVLNTLWSFLFFGLKSPLLALVEILALWLAIGMTYLSFYRKSRPAALLLLPYLAWVTFASFLNFLIWQMN